MKKLVFRQKQMILTSEQCAEHPFAGRNTQQQEDWRKPTVFLLIKKTEWKCPFVTYKKSTFTIIKPCPFYKASAFIFLTATAKTFRLCIEWDNRLSGISSIVGKQKKRVNGMDLFLFFFSFSRNLFWLLKDFIMLKTNFKN